MRQTGLTQNGAQVVHARRTDVAACLAVSDWIHSQPMAKFHVLAAAGDSAEEFRSLGLYEAASARDALVRCLAQLHEDPVDDHAAALGDPELAELLRRDQQHLRDVLAELDVSFIVTRVEAEAHFVRDYDGLVKPAVEVERRRARMRWDFGVDVV